MQAYKMQDFDEFEDDFEEDGGFGGGDFEGEDYDEYDDFDDMGYGGYDDDDYQNPDSDYDDE